MLTLPYTGNNEDYFVLRYTLTLPTRDNSGRDLTAEHAHIRSRLLRDFDGFTAHKARGYWRGADDMRYAESVVVYTVDAPDTSESYAKLHALAQALKASGGQEAIYLTRSPVETWLI